MIKILRKLRYLKFKIFDSKRYGNLVLENFKKLKILVLEETFNPSLYFSTEFFIDSILNFIQSGKSVLDLGTGTGVIGIFCAKSGAKVLSSDINEEAIRSAKINSLLNKTEKNTDFRVSNLFENFENEKFDFILFNPPFYKGQPRDLHDFSWRAGENFETFVNFLNEFEFYLNENGKAFIVLSTNSRLPEILNDFRGKISINLIAKKNLITEKLFVYELKTKNAKKN